MNNSPTLLAVIGWIFLAVLLPSSASADWIESGNPLVIKPKPSSGSVELQNPPGFFWVRADGAQGYKLLLVGPGGEEKVWEASRNWFLPSSRLKPGNYTWKVRPNGPKGSWSNPRPFSISASAAVFEVPDEEQLLQFIRSRNRPRSLSPGGESISEWGRKIRSQQPHLVESLENQVKIYASKPLPDERAVMLVPKSKNEQSWADSLAKIREVTQYEYRQLRAAAILWRITGDKFYLEEAERRGDAFASLDPKGSTSHIAQDQGNRYIAWGLAFAYDYLGSDLPSQKRAVWLDAIKTRTAAIYSDLESGNWRLEQTPFDSHGATNFGYVAAISALMIDSLPEAENWFRNTFRSYVNYQSPWGDEQGGYGNGSAYAEYSVALFSDFWDAMASATGVSMYQKPWSKGLLRFLACFVPPGSPTHAFGDAAETKPSISNLKPYATRYDDDFALWYSQSLNGSEDPRTLLTKPVSETKSAVSAKPPEENSCFFKHIGWAAMHSKWADPHRISVYFKSSPYGSFNHSHADQNSFTLVSDGQPLLIDAGVYDWYGSPQWKKWYRQTAAHNAITFDNGKGQDTGDGARPSAEATMSAQGKITRFQPARDADFVEGEATRAYSGALTRAIRKTWFLRNKETVIILDDLASGQDRIFEWNAHALSNFRSVGGDTYEIQSGNQTACIDVLSPSGGSVKITEGFPVPPSTRPSANNWHFRYSAPKSAKTAQFVVAIRVNCANSKAQLNAGKVTVGGEMVDLGK